MKAGALIIRLFISLAALFLFNTAEAGSPLWTFTPLTATTLSIPSNGTATIQYQITNQSRSTHTLTMNPITGVTQNIGGGYCGNPFTLAYQQSCVLNLTVNGSAIPSHLAGGPVVCQQGSGLQCYQPSASDVLNLWPFIQWAVQSMVFLAAWYWKITVAIHSPLRRMARLTLLQANILVIAIQ